METKKRGPKPREQKREDVLRLLVSKGVVIGRRRLRERQKLPTFDDRNRVYELRPPEQIEYPEGGDNGGQRTWHVLNELALEGLCAHRMRRVRHADHEELVDEFYVDLEVLEVPE
jgi:hypothetical protein